MLDGVQDSGLGNLMEDNAPGFVCRESQDLKQVPRDGLSLAVFITCEPDKFCLVCLVLEFLDLLLLVFGYLVERLEAILNIDAKVLFV